MIWILRTIIAVVVCLLYVLIMGPPDLLSACFLGVVPPILTIAVCWFIPSLKEDNRETRCRKCRYILRGITEPRCPECGERI